MAQLAAAGNCTVWSARAVAAAQDHIDPRHQLARAERLGDIVVAADLETEHAIDLVVARRQEQDRHIGGLADLAADIEPVQLRHADIEHDEGRLLSRKLRQRLDAVARLGGDHAGLAQGEANHLPDMRVVVDDKDAMSQGPCSRASFYWHRRRPRGFTAAAAR